MQDWLKTPSGDDCLWCPWSSNENLDYEPFDSDDADAMLCRGHVAEYEGVSLDGLDRMEAEQAYDEL